VESQLFVPAGRSFFTSIGKAIAAFDRGGILDPITVRFGRVFSSMRDRGLFRRLRWDEVDKRDHLARELVHEFFGGKFRITRDQEFVETDDGRKVPFAMLSSGQQELLPLIFALESFRFRSRNRMYIEEPEAHLFPTAQRDLVDYLVSSVFWSDTRHLFVTTHSPYILARFNVLMKAGKLARQRRNLARQIMKITGRNFSVKPGSLAAYAILDKEVVALVGKDGLIDGNYLDEVSGDLAREFSALLEIEYTK
jgi:hypothetical protein